MKWSKVIYLSIVMLPAANAAILVGSFHAPTNVDPVDQQSVSTVTRTTGGNADTNGAVAGTINIMAGQEVGNPADYPGIDVRTFSAVTQYNDLKRFGGDGSGGLITWDYDFSTYFSGKTIGNSNGDSQISLELGYSNRRTSSGNNGIWYISYNGGGLTLDTTDVTTHTVSSSTSGAENGTLVADANLYKEVLTLTANTGSGAHSVDLTADFANLVAGDGLVRIAYLETEFQGDIRVNDMSGIVETVVVPEPSSALLLLISSLAFLIRRR
ncbi:MAG: PEP-CTERM sorting domain-containing protein [Akkermansiaceae bacterium]